MFTEPQNHLPNHGHQKKRPNSTGISNGSNHRDSNRRTNRARNPRPNDGRSTERDETSNQNNHESVANDQLNETTRDDNTQTGQNAHILLQTSNSTIKIAGGDNYNTTHNDVTIAGGNNYTTSEDNDSTSGQLCRRDVNIVANDNNNIRIETNVTDENEDAAIENQNPILDDDEDVASQQIPDSNNDLHNVQDNSDNPPAKNIPNGSINILVGNDNTIVIKNVAMGRCQRKITVNKSNSDPYSAGNNDNSDQDSDEEERASNTNDNVMAQDADRQAVSFNGDSQIFRFPELFNS